VGAGSRACSTRLRYAVVTWVRGDYEGLARLKTSLVEQALAPTTWIVVDDASTREHSGRGTELTADTPWPTHVVREARDADGAADLLLALRSAGFHPDELPEALARVSTDVTLPSDYFDRVLRAFTLNPLLGMAAGVFMDRAGGEWRPLCVASDHAAVTASVYRRECLLHLAQPDEGCGAMAGLEELRAELSGWLGGTVHETADYSQRTPVRVSSAPHWTALGRTSHYMGYRPFYLMLRALRRALDDPAALLMIVSYAVAALRRTRRLADDAVVAELRKQQRLRRLRSRARDKPSGPDENELQRMRDTATTRERT